MSKSIVSKFIAMPANEEGVYMIVQVSEESDGNDTEDYASVVGAFIKEEDDDGVYYVMPDTNSDSQITDFIDGYKSVLIAFHESKVSESDVPWEVFRDVIAGKIEMINQQTNSSNY
jgi:hypothetical protein